MNKEQLLRCDSVARYHTSPIERKEKQSRIFDQLSSLDSLTVAGLEAYEFIAASFKSAHG